MLNANVDAIYGMEGFGEEVAAENSSTASTTSPISSLEELKVECVEQEFGGPLERVYKTALKFYKDNERTGELQVDYPTRLRFMALARHVKYGPFNEETADCGWFDLVGNDARREWKKLSDEGNLTPHQVMWEFVRLLDAICPTTFRQDVRRRVAIEAPPLIQKQLPIGESHIAKLNAYTLRPAEFNSNGVDSNSTDSEEAKQVLLRYQQQKQQIQEALNKQTYHQFLAYAQQTHPGEPHKQEQLIKQLQEQHYEQYMSQVYAQQAQAQVASLSGAVGTENARESSISSSEDSEPRAPHQYQQRGLEKPPASVLVAKMNEMSVKDREEEDGDDENGSEVSDEEEQQAGESQPANPQIAPANMWSAKQITDFKAAIKKEGPDGVMKIGHGETVTVRVPTHEEGTSLYWEFATDHYDIGFGLYFEWTVAESNQVTVHVSESDEDEEEEEEVEEGAGSIEMGSRTPSSRGAGAESMIAAGDVESGGGLPTGPRRKRDPNKPRIDEVIPMYRRDAHLEMLAGNHTYPGQGVYLLKFDNSYSLWRSKTLYYRVFYSK